MKRELQEREQSAVRGLLLGTPAYRFPLPASVFV
jgi:hypothetical protein